MTKPYRCLVGSFQQLNRETGLPDEFSRGDMVILTAEEAAAHPGAFEPWNVVEPEEAPSPAPADDAPEAPAELEEADDAPEAPAPATKSRKK